MVTGSKHLVHLDDGRKILLDCGMFQGMGKQTIDLNSDWGFDPTQVDAVLLSHAHIDHSGLLPKLYKDGYRGPVFCTPATAELATLLLEDSAEIQRDDARFYNKRRAKQGLSPVEPLYGVEEARLAAEYLVQREYNEVFDVLEGVTCMFTDAGHIIGSAAVHLAITSAEGTVRISFSGDVGRYRDDIVRSPATFPQADYIILESTYGNALHDEVHGTVEQLYKWIDTTCFQKKGKLIIPAFSVGRTQALLLALNQLDLENRLRGLPVIVDSPLSKETTALIQRYPNYFNKRLQQLLLRDENPFGFRGLRFTENSLESKALNDVEEPMIIISASGMADAGRIKHHIMNTIRNPKNTILIVGYCEPNSLGGKLMRGEKEVKIFGDLYPVAAEVGVMRAMSAHGDYDDLMQWLGCQHIPSVRELFLVHGEEEVMQDFYMRLQRKGFQVTIPALHAHYPLA